MNQQDSGKSRKGMRSGPNRGQPEMKQEHGPFAMPDRSGENISGQQQQRQEKSGQQQVRQQGTVPDTNVNTAHTGYHYDDERDDEGYLRDNRDEERMEEEAEETH